MSMKWRRLRCLLSKGSTLTGGNQLQAGEGEVNEWVRQGMQSSNHSWQKGEAQGRDKD